MPPRRYGAAQRNCHCLHRDLCSLIINDLCRSIAIAKKTVDHFLKPCNIFDQAQGGQWTPKMVQNNNSPKTFSQASSQDDSRQWLLSVWSRMSSHPEMSQKLAGGLLFCRFLGFVGAGSSRVDIWWSREPGTYTSASQRQLHQTKAGRHSTIWWTNWQNVTKNVTKM